MRLVESFMLVWLIAGLGLVSHQAHFHWFDWLETKILTPIASFSASSQVPPTQSAALAPVPSATISLETSNSSSEISQSALILPFKREANAIQLRGTINNVAKPVSFVLDTGATYTSISKQTAKALGINLAGAPTVRVTTSNGAVDVPRIRLKQIQIQGLTIRNVEATVMDLGESTSISGLLGLSFINRFRLMLDPVRGQLILDPIAT